MFLKKVFFGKRPSGTGFQMFSNAKALYLSGKLQYQSKFKDRCNLVDGTVGIPFLGQY